jgi:ankyrin repeat protein
MARDLATGLDSLHLAVSYNRTDIVRLLVKKYGANPNIKNSDGMNSLHICARNGNSGRIFFILLYTINKWSYRSGI